MDASLDSDFITIPTQVKTPQNINLLWILSSKFFERIAFMGIRSMITLHMVRMLEFPREEVIELYSWLLIMVGIMQVLGALINDFILKDTYTMPIGCTLLAIGCFVLIIPTKECFYIGTLLTLLGSGIYTPTSLALLGKSYVGNQRIMLIGFTVFIAIYYIGGVLAPVIVNLDDLLSTDATFSVGFMISGIAAILAALTSFFAKRINGIEHHVERFSISVRSLAVILLFILAVLFGFSLNTTFLLANQQFSYDQLLLLQSSWVVIFAFLLCVIWLVKTWNSWFTMIFAGLLIFLVALILYMNSILILIPIGVIVSYVLFMGMAEVLFFVSLYSNLTTYISPKYLSTAIACLFLLTFFTNRLVENFTEQSHTISLAIVIGCTILFIVLTYFLE